MTEYRITGRYRKDKKRFVCAGAFSDKIRSREQAERRLQELKENSEREMKRKQRAVVQAGAFSISTPYESDYDLLDLRIETREVTPWEVVK